MALGRKPAKEEFQEAKVIEINAQMEGSLSFTDPVNLRINGHFKGNLSIKGTLTVGESASDQANIVGDNIIIAGKVKGDITANKMLVLMPSATLKGNISTPKLNIVEGANFQGQCEMSSGYMNLEDVARYLEIDTQEIESLASSGKVPAIKQGNAWKFDREQIDEWAASAKVD
ncbi:MAG: polymer-forming cytoskeletal protein [Sedimentisphaerales bacterium]|nr:polymer-forming cytoskeletal protein [Sedimentisphaerales bacterium]